MLHLEERLRMGDEIMKTYIYEGGFGIVAKSGVGSAIKHQKNMLKQADIEEAKSWKEADIVHINTVFPDSVLAACLAKMQGKKVVYYGHSTMEDFRNHDDDQWLGIYVSKKEAKEAYDRAVAWWDEEREYMHYSTSQRVAMFEYIAEDDRFREVERKELD